MAVKELNVLEKNPLDHNDTPSPNKNGKDTSSKKAYIESYGCQMNFADSEVVASILTKEGYTHYRTTRSSISGLSQYLFHP